jgi:putative ABC transport system ATP-binding protein
MEKHLTTTQHSLTGPGRSLVRPVLPILRGKNLKKDYSLGKVIVPALKGVSVAIKRGEFLSLAGPSGSGKTTLLNLLGCIEKPTSGQVFFSAQDTSSLSANELSELRLSCLGFIFQSFNLLPVLSALENVELPLMLKGVSAAQRREQAYRALELVGLTDFAQHRPNELSGGQRQRVAIARAIAPQPLLVLADEPTANLDQATGHEIIDLMHQIKRSQGTTFVICTHDPRVIAKTERIIRLNDGLLAEQT